MRSPQGTAVVLAGRLRQRPSRTRPSTSTAVRVGAADRQSTMHLYPINGAAHDVGPDDTAWAYRDATWGSVIAGIDPDPANAARSARWTMDYFEALHPYSAGGAYVNMMMDEGRGARAGQLPRQLRPTRPDQGALRPGQPLPGQPEHQASHTYLTNTVEIIHQPGTSRPSDWTDQRDGRRSMSTPDQDQLSKGSPSCGRRWPHGPSLLLDPAIASRRGPDASHARTGLTRHCASCSSVVPDWASGGIPQLLMTSRRNRLSTPGRKRSVVQGRS